MDYLNYLISEDEIYKKYFKHYQVEFYDIDNVIKDENYEDLICPICLFILNNPLNCSEQKNSHSFCKNCIEKYIQYRENKCPICKRIFEFKKNDDKIHELNKLSFKCSFKNEGCNKIVKYSEYLNHINNCEYNNKYVCQIKNFNYEKKIIDICGTIIDKMNIKVHLKICALKKFNCIFCKKSILQKDIEDHYQND